MFWFCHLEEISLPKFGIKKNFQISLFPRLISHEKSQAHIGSPSEISTNYVIIIVISLEWEEWSFLVNRNRHSGPARRASLGHLS